MDKMRYFVTVRAVIVDQLGVNEEEVTLESRLIEDLAADSLDLVELIMAFEDEFGDEISDEEAQGMSTVNDILEYLLETHQRYR